MWFAFGSRWVGEGGLVFLVHILEAIFTTDDLVFRLTTVEAGWDLSMLLLTLVTSAGGFAFA